MGYRLSLRWFQAAERLGGFTENFWSASGTLAAANTDAMYLSSLLNAMHGRQTVLQNIRVANSTNQRDVSNTPSIISIPPPKGDGADSDYFNTALLLKLTNNGTPGYTTYQWIRSVWDSWVDNGGRMSQTSDFSLRATPFLNFLVSTPSTPSNMRMCVLDKSLLKKRVTGITLTGLVTCPAHGYPDQSVVRISGARGMTGVNRVWVISLIDANSFQLVNAVGLGGAMVSNAKPTARLQSRILMPITGAIFVRATSHRTGRPSALLGGRPKKKV